MTRPRRYAVAVLVAAAVTVGAAVVTPNPVRKLILFISIALVYSVGTAVALRYPDAIWGRSGNWVSAALAGVTTFATLGLLQGVGGGENVAAAVLGWGLTAFGFVAGVAFEREREQESTEDVDAAASRDGSSAD